jgi:hypothetical protein
MTTSSTARPNTAAKLAIVPCDAWNHHWLRGKADHPTADPFNDTDDYRHQRKLVVGKLADDEARLIGLDGQRTLYKMLHCPEEQSTDRPMPRRIIDAAIDCDQSIFLNGLT